MLSVGLLFYGRLACCAVLAFFALVFGHSGARPQPQNAAICGVLLRLRFRAGLRAFFSGLLVLGPLARATPCEPSGLGPGWGHDITSKKRSWLEPAGPKDLVRFPYVDLFSDQTSNESHSSSYFRLLGVI